MADTFQKDDIVRVVDASNCASLRDGAKYQVWKALPDDTGIALTSEPDHVYPNWRFVRVSADCPRQDLVGPTASSFTVKEGDAVTLKAVITKVLDGGVIHYELPGKGRAYTITGSVNDIATHTPRSLKVGDRVVRTDFEGQLKIPCIIMEFVEDGPDRFAVVKHAPGELKSKPFCVEVCDLRLALE